MLPPSDRAFFAEHGWLVLRQAVSLDRIACWSSAIDRAHDRHPEAFVDLTGHAVIQAAGLTRALPELRPILEGQPLAAHGMTLGALARDLLDCAAVRLLQDLVLIKGPASTSNRIGWHQDYGYSRYLDRPSTVSIRIALDPETATSGAMQVRDGSHRYPVLLDPVHGDGFVHDAAIAQVDPATLIDYPPLTLALAPGDISVHHCLTLHASPPNAAPTPRRTLIHHVFDAECRLVPHLLPNPELAPFLETDDDGRLIAPLYPELP